MVRDYYCKARASAGDTINQKKEIKSIKKKKKKKNEKRVNIIPERCNNKVSGFPM